MENSEVGMKEYVLWPVCQYCGKSVSTAQGVLVVYGHEISEYEKLFKEWGKSYPRTETGSRLITSRELADLPHMVDWHWGHSDCVQDGVMYEITYDRFDNVEKVLNWTLHLMEKNWLEHTRWREAVLAHYQLQEV